MYPRFITERLQAALADSRVVLLSGARQTGKSTLARAHAAAVGARYVTFDDPSVLAAARDATGFLDNLGERIVIDEVQRAPWLFSAIKVSVDRDPRPGRFLLTGSANVLVLPGLSDSLAGRMEILKLRPLCQGEIEGRRGRFLESLFDGRPWRLQAEAAAGERLTGRLARGGYPEMARREAFVRREAWMVSYLRTLIERDVRDLANIEGLVDLPRLLALLAARSGALLNISEISRALGMAHTTLKRYLALLQAIHILDPLPAWSDNLGKRLIKAPKIHLLDSAMAAHLARYDAGRLEEDRTFYGHLLESFVVAELATQAGWSDNGEALFHYRTASGQEVDAVIEDRRGRLAGVEVKAAATLAAKDADGLKAFARDAGNRFAGGALLYTGAEVLPFGEKIWALPVSALWRAVD